MTPLQLPASVAEELVTAFDLTGTFVFALSGATLGVQRRLDLFGVLVLSFAASSAGGIARDVLIGAVPPASISDWRYLVVSLVAGGLTFLAYSRVSRLRVAILIFDAAGLSLFAVAGATKALAYGLNPVMAALMGVLTGVGGGVARDLLVARTPAVLQRELYAVCALAASGLMVVGHLRAWPPLPTGLVAAALCFGSRLLALRFGWNLPVARTPDGDRE